jgi:hypothetical protein
MRATSLLVSVFMMVPIGCQTMQAGSEPEVAESRTLNCESAVGGRVFGRITDQAGRPVAAVQVFIAGLPMRVLSQRDGGYQLPNVPRGCHRLIAERIGYERLEVEFASPGRRMARIRGEVRPIGVDSMRIDLRMEQIQEERSPFRLLQGSSEPPIVVVDGAVIDSEGQPDIRSRRIESLRVVTGRSAVDEFGLRSLDRVIVITTAACQREVRLPRARPRDPCRPR